jgi:hypothetical protein
MPTYVHLAPGDPVPWFHQRSFGNSRYAAVVLKDGVPVTDEDSHGSRIEQRAIALLAFAQDASHPVPLGDVHQGD